MTRIFISYRRADSRLVTNRIYDRLVAAFGRDDIFKDVDDIPPGRDFRGVLREATASCEVMLVVIGPDWLDIREANDPNIRRLENPEDFVRLEVETGLRQDDIRLIPLLVEGAHMPSADDLPDSLRELAFYNAFTIQDDPYFHRNMDSLINHLQGDLPRQRSMRRWWMWIGGGVALMILIIVALMVLLTLTNSAQNTMTETPTDAVAAIPSATAQLPTTEATPTMTVPPSFTPNPPTTTSTATDAPTSTPSLTHTPSDTPDFDLLALTFEANQTATQGTIYQQETATQRVALTATATLWTDTPTPDRTREFTIFLTDRAASTQTQEAVYLTATADSWTDTPTPTLTFTPSPTPIAAVSANDQWTPVIQEFDGMEMVLVPPGCFLMGNEDGDEDEKPVHEICFDAPFWLDRYEVTQGDFVRLGGIQARSPRFLGDSLPIENITWFEARDFCALRDSRLPTEAEWEYAARGPDSLVYPWGNEFDGDYVVFSVDFNSTMATVGSRPGGRSWVNALDLSGNAWEWVSTIYDQTEFPYPYTMSDGREDLERINVSRSRRGGAWNVGTDNVRAADRTEGHSDNFGIGFRCARDG